MNFNFIGSLLAVSSERGTVHVFRLGSGQGGQGSIKVASSSSSSSAGGGSNNTWDAASSPSDSVDGTTQGLDGGYDAFIEKKKSSSVSSSLRRKSMQMTKSLTHSMGGYLPNTITEMWEPSRDFAFFHLPTSGVRSVVALSGTMPHVMVLTSEGYFYLYSIDLEKGGECALLKQYNLLDSNDELGTD